MQFSCESCKTQLQIADEKVRGKRLIVRCKRCGAKIGISDPALGPPRAAPRPAASAPPPSQPAPAPRAAAAPAAGAVSVQKRDSDTESTLAIDIAVLESLFPQLPAPPNPPPPIAAVGQGLREFSAADFAAPVASAPPAAEQPQPAAAAPAPAADEERTAVDPLPFGER